jgi:F-box interacting protein
MATTVPSKKKKIAIPAAADIADDAPVLPVDLVYDILLRVPAKPLCRFRAVCPSWRSLLCDPTFIATHAARHPSLLIAVAMENTRTDVQILDMSGNVVRRLKSGQQCLTDDMWTHHGLVFLKGKDGRHHVLDPATGDTSVLPDRPSQVYMYTVGWAAAAEEYKVLIIRKMDLQEEVCMVLSLGDKNHGWRERGSPPAWVGPRGEVAVVRGIAYFLVSGIKCGWDDWIVAFDLELEAWRPASIRGPMEEQDNPIYGSCVSLAEVHGHLVASVDKRSSDTCVVELWFLTDPHEPLWSKRYNITLATTRDVFESFGMPLQVLKDGRILVWIWKQNPKYRGVPRVYDPETETFTEGAASAGRRVVAGVYTGSLLRTVSALP